MKDINTLDGRLEFDLKNNKRNGIKEGNEYFNSVINSLERVLRDVKSYQKDFEQSPKTDYLEWAANSVQQISQFVPEVMRASQYLYTVKAIEMLNETMQEIKDGE